MNRIPIGLFIVCAVLALGMVACSGGASTPTPTATPSPPVEGELRRGEELSFWDQVTVTFLGVSNDSRCAEGVECVRAGEAYVQVSLTLPGQRPADTTMVIEPGGETWTSYAGYLVTLTALEPDPPPLREAGEFIDYVAHIVISEESEE